jgi:hypothetical protein
VAGAQAVEILLSLVSNKTNKPLFMARPTKKKDLPQVNPELTGFDIHINEFGEISTSFDINRLNTFLDENTDDKKFRGIEVTRVKPTEEEPSPEA